MQTDYTAQRLSKAYHAASNQAQAAWGLYAALTDRNRLGLISAEATVFAQAHCEALAAQARQAEAALVSHRAAQPGPFSTAYEAQQRTTAHLQAA